MRKFDPLNYQPYERYLTPFGRKVLGNLIKNLEERNKCSKNVMTYRDHGAQNKHVLTFGESSVIPPSIPYLANESIIESNIGDKFTIQTSEGLLKTMNENKGTEKITASCSKLYDQSNEINRPRDEQVCSDNLDEIQVTQSHIEWDNIFDSQLLQDMISLDVDVNSNQFKYEEINKPVPEKENITPTYSKSNNEETKTVVASNTTKPICENLNVIHKTGDILKILDNLPLQKNVEKNCSLVQPILKDDSNDLSSIENNMVTEVAKNAGTMEKVKAKRRLSTKITDTITKKIKKTQNEQPKESFRKQKYTKTVKTWLNDIDPEKFVESIDPQENLDDAYETNESKDKIKKIVQAKLTCKDGVMKFGKPRKESINTEKQKNIDVLTKTSVIANDKKVKPKFIPPIKSQIPVMDINYTINHINDDNYQQFEKEFTIINKTEIVMVLIFSNGYCQLNSQYTEDICVAEGVLFQVNSTFYYWKGIYKKFWGTLKKLLELNTIICYDGKNLLKYFATEHEMDINDTEINVLDTQIGGSLLDPDNPPENFADVQKLLDFVPQYTVATECPLQKGARYLATLLDCSVKLRTLLNQHDLTRVFVDIEMRVLPIIAEMEARGVPVDVERLRAMEGALGERLRASEAACHAAAGRAFLPGSPAQVRAILYEQLRLDARCHLVVQETVAKGDKSTSEAMLRNLTSVHPLPGLILEYRRLHKAHATFLAGIAQHLRGGVVRPTWVQTAAATGRIACSNPNLQAIPKTPFHLAPLAPNTDRGGEDETEGEVVNFRCVYAARAGHAVVAADFKHVECRVMAHAAGDAALLAALASPDLFRVLAAAWLKKEEAEVSAADRERTKRIVYASLYGAGARTLAHLLDTTYERALDVAATFNASFPGVRRFVRAVGARAARGGRRLATASGRARTFPHIDSGDFALRSQAQRQAVNFLVQGAAADVCKAAMVATAARLRSARPPVSARLLLQLHDELLWEVDRRHLHAAAAIIKSAMESAGLACGIVVPLPVALRFGPNWGDMEEFEPDTLLST